MIADSYDDLGKICNKQISHFRSDITPMVSGQTFGELMYFIGSIGY